MALHEINFDDIQKGYRDVEDPGHERYSLPQGTDWGENVLQQDSTSAGTSRNTIAKPFTDRNIPWSPGKVNLDIGGGKYDTATAHMQQRGVTNLVFDPYNRDPEHNNKVLDYIDRIGGADTVTVNNVLNVIRGKDIIMSVIRQAAEAVKPEGTVFFKIYDAGKGAPAYTRDGFQQSKPVEQYVPLISQYFSRLKVSTGKGIDIIAAAGPKGIEGTHADFYPDVNGKPRQLNLVKEGEKMKVTINELRLRNYIRQQLREAAGANMDQEYMAAVQAGDMEKAYKMVEATAERMGYTIHAYHGTARADRVGNKFDPARATSGPMAFFTSDKQIASNYARDKRDTSIEYDGEELYSYKNQFKAKLKGYKPMTLDKLWWYLPAAARKEIASRAGHIRADWNGDGGILYDENTTDANGGFKGQVTYYKDNVLAALVFNWLESGTLYNEEEEFLKVLELTGLNKYLEEPVKWNNPNYREEKVYDVFLKITKPFDTNRDYTEASIDGFEQWWFGQDMSKYDKESMSTDPWDKNDVVIEDWIEQARDEAEKGDTYAFTSIPDAFTDYLKSFGCDGIIDRGGKYGGASHQVYIPFYPNQVKSAEAVVYDDRGNIIPLSQRFSNNDDIRYEEE